METSHESGIDLDTPAKTVTIDEISRVTGMRQRPPVGIETGAAHAIFEPENAEQIADLIRLCEEHAITLAPVGAGRTLATMRAEPVAIGVSMARMAALVAYEPDDMTVVAEAGMTMGALQDLLAARRQHLPLDPPQPATVTLGALVGAGRSGPCRLSEGTPRDLLIGVRFAGHGGRLVHGGGRVVKNVAGYDLMKVMTGSFGTLGIITEVTFRVRPLPERYRMVRIAFGTIDDAFGTARQINNSVPLIHLEVLSPGAAARVGYSAQAGNYVVSAGICGNRAETDYIAARIDEISAAPVEVLQLASALKEYRAMRDLVHAPGEIALQIAVPPSALERCVSAAGADFRAHAGSGVAQLFISADRPAEEIRDAVDQIRAIAVEARGHLRVTSMPSGLSGVLDIFGTPNAGVMALMRRLKLAFDPAGIFNPGSFVGGL